MMFTRFKNINPKYFWCLITIWFPFVGLMVGLSFGHLDEIVRVAGEESQDALISAETRFLESRLGLEAALFSEEFTNIQDEVHILASFCQKILVSESQVSFRNGSRYKINSTGVYGNNNYDGNSALFVPHYRPDLDSLIYSTEGIDLYLKPLFEVESKVVLRWLIHRDGLLRTYPWRNLEEFPRDKELSSWPFFFLASPDQNPDRTEVFTPPYIDPLSGEWMVSCLSPVFIDGEHVATVGADITIQDLLSVVNKFHFTPGTMIMILSESKIIAASENLELSSLGLDPSIPLGEQDLAHITSSRFWELALKPSKKTSEVSFFTNGRLQLFVGVALVKSLNWRIVLIAPKDEVLAPALEYSQQIIVNTQEISLNFLHLLVFTFFCVAILIYLVIFHQSRGLKELLTGIKELGSGNLSYRVMEDATEYGKLGQALNVMSARLQEKKQELTKALLEIEQGRKLTAVGRLAAGVAHEVNNPLATISTYTQTVLGFDGLPKPAADRLKKIMEEITRIQRKLQDLLDLSRVQPPIRTKTDLNLLVKEVVEIAQHEADSRGVVLNLFLDPDGQEFYVDRSGFKQIMWNLLSNAFDALEEGGTVTVSTQFVSVRDGACDFILEIVDDGIGIPESILGQVFEPFITTKEVGKGTGLGLAITYGIVVSHGGAIEVRNQTPSGCKIRIVLPGEDRNG